MPLLPNHTDYSQVVSTTTPGLSYSIGELLARTVRGERLPGFAPQEEVDKSPVVDWTRPEVAKKEMDDISEQMDKDAIKPDFNGDFDHLDAKTYLQSTES